MSKFSEQMTLTEVAAVLGISRQRVKQIETVALEKLRKNPKVRGLYEGIIDGRNGSGYSVLRIRRLMGANKW
jgi:hypothetical protein